MDAEIAARIARKIMQRANDGYGRRGDYPAFSTTPWDDRLRWSGYVEKVAAEVIAEEVIEGGKADAA